MASNWYKFMRFSKNNWKDYNVITAFSQNELAVRCPIHLWIGYHDPLLITYQIHRTIYLINLINGNRLIVSNLTARPLIKDFCAFLNQWPRYPYAWFPLLFQEYLYLTEFTHWLNLSGMKSPTSWTKEIKSEDNPNL